MLELTTAKSVIFTKADLGERPRGLPPPHHHPRLIWVKRKKITKGRKPLLACRLTTHDCLEYWTPLLITWPLKIFVTLTFFVCSDKFGCLAWSASEKSLLYVAEKKLPKAVSYFERQNTGMYTDYLKMKKCTSSQCQITDYIYKSHPATNHRIKRLESLSASVSCSIFCRLLFFRF